MNPTYVSIIYPKYFFCNTAIYQTRYITRFNTKRNGAINVELAPCTCISESYKLELGKGPIEAEAEKHLI